MMAPVARMIRRLVRNHPVIPAGPEAMQLAARLSGVAGSSLVWCNCGRLLTPIVFARPEEPADIIALACLACRGSVPVCVGIVGSAPAPEFLLSADRP